MTEGVKTEPKNLQPTQVIAKLYGSTTRQIEYLAKNGVIQSEGRPAKYDLVPTIQALFKYQRDIIQSKEKSEEDSKNESDKLDGEARIKQAKAEMQELKLKELRGELHRAEDVEAIITDHVMYLRSMLMAMPGKLAVDCAELTSAPEVADRIKQEVYQVLNSLADYEYDAEAYKQRVREREGWNDQQEDGDE